MYMTEEKKSKIILIVGLAIPLIAIIFIMLLVYIPKESIKPKYDFLYYIKNNNYYPGYLDKCYEREYFVSNNKISINSSCSPKEKVCWNDLEGTVIGAGVKLGCTDDVELIEIKGYTSAVGSNNFYSGGQGVCPSSYDYCVENYNDGRGNYLLIGVKKSAALADGFCPSKKVIYCNDYLQKVDLPKIYRFSSKDSTKTQITFEDAKLLTLDNNTISPDGLRVRNGGYGRGNYGIFEIFGNPSYNDYNSIFLVDDKGNSEKIIDNLTDYYNFSFIGWVISDSK